MYDDKLVEILLNNILWSLEQIEKRFAPIGNPDAFTADDLGLEKLDSICMQLITLGESLKQLDKVTDGSLLQRYSAVDWKKAKGLRDIITHHYFDLDAEIVFTVCKKHIPVIKDEIRRILSDVCRN
jgi:uncharacterized protein with HEPN domain